jgi:hypothetical protein
MSEMKKLSDRRIKQLLANDGRALEGGDFSAYEFEQALRELQVLRAACKAAEEREKRMREAYDELKKPFCEYADCLQHLCMNVLYEPCRPVSHSWPGKRHIDTIREGVAFLLAENKRLRAQEKTPNGRTIHDAIKETEHLLAETFDDLEPGEAREEWYMTRITKIREALRDRPALSEATR